MLAVDADFASGFAGYLRDYGCRALRYDVAEPNLDEEPELVLALVRDQLATGYDPADSDRALTVARQEAHASARRLLADRPDDLERFERALRDALAAYPVREDNEFFTVSAPLALARRVALEVGRRLTGRSLIDEPDHAFELTSSELREALLSPDAAGVRDLVRRRLGERAWVLAHPGPSSYGTPPAPPSLAGLPRPARHTREAFLWTTERNFGTAAIEEGGVRPDGVLAGVPASAGRWTGTVRVVHGEDEFSRIRPGDVLVCSITSPVWSVVFPSIGALVTDTGGILSHPAIIAREYGIPAVVATREGTTRLGDGQVVLGRRHRRHRDVHRQGAVVTVVTGTLSPVAEGSATLAELTHALQAAAALAAATGTGALTALDHGPRKRTRWPAPAPRRHVTPNSCWSRSRRSASWTGRSTARSG